MKTYLKAVVALTVAALLGGCASTKGNDQQFKDALLCIALGPFCPLVAATSSSSESADTSSSSSAQARAAFTSWADLRRDTVTDTNGLHTSVLYETRPDGSIMSVSERTSADQAYDGYFLVQYDAQGKPVHLDLGGGGGWGSRSSSAHGGHVSLAAVGQPWVDFGRSDTLQGSPPTPFTTLGAREIELVANPYVLGWNYQSFGVWNVTDPSWVNFGGATFGSATPASAVPTSGNATFRGKLGGLYVSPAGQGSIATADLSVNANFSTRSLSFASSGTSVTRDLATAIAAPNLNLSGTLTYSPSANTFTGTLVNAGGTMSGSSKGQFYGPTAQELGGVFTVKSPTTVETFAGAYGAKR